MKTKHKAALGGASACCIAAVFITPWEGVKLQAYHDRLAYGIPTVCMGETENVHMGDSYTVAQCAEMLQKKLPRYNEEISQCIDVPISDKTRAAFISGAYNFGSAAFCRSTIARRLNAGDYAGACDAIMAFDRAGGRVVNGLVRRREAERKLCLEGLVQ